MNRATTAKLVEDFATLLSKAGVKYLDDVKPLKDYISVSRTGALHNKNATDR